MLRTVISDNTAAAYPAAMVRSSAETIWFLTFEGLTWLLVMVRSNLRDRALFLIAYRHGRKVRSRRQQARPMRHAEGRASMSEHAYASYLKLDKLLSSQQLMTESDDELLFIIIHQAHELWFKLAIHELSCATKALLREQPSKTDCIIAYKRLSRISEIQRVLIASWSVLTTLTPDEFHVFRLTVGQNNASGFQSIQYRIFEFKLGLKYRMVHFEKLAKSKSSKQNQSPRFEIEERDIFAHVRSPDERQALEKALAEPSIYDSVVQYMSRHLRRFGIAPPADHALRYRKQRAVFEAWQYVYHNRENEPELYQLGEKLVDLEDAFRRWRFAHLATVSRVIGNSTGTGGSTGLRYLREVANQLLDDPIYPELWDIRNAMFSRTEFDLDSAGY